jgi:hypothetical protein
MQTQSSRGLMLSLGAALAVLTIQGLSGDFLNLFVSFPSGSEASRRPSRARA